MDFFTHRHQKCKAARPRPTWRQRPLPLCLPLWVWAGWRERTFKQEKLSLSGFVDKDVGNVQRERGAGEKRRAVVSGGGGGVSTREYLSLRKIVMSSLRVCVSLSRPPPRPAPPVRHQKLGLAVILPPTHSTFQPPQTGASPGERRFVISSQAVINCLRLASSSHQAQRRTEAAESCLCRLRGGDGDGPPSSVS